MRPFKALERRLGWKLFLSYLIVVMVGTVVLASTAKFEAPVALSRHMAHMETMMGDNAGLAADLRDSFVAAVNEVLVVAALAAALAAVIVSIFTTRRIVGPIQAMMQASQRIAAGDYHQRVQILSEDELGALVSSFNRMAETLEQTERRRVELIGDLAHEFRTPLSSIRSIMEGLVDGVLPADPATFLDIQREISRLQRLVNDLLELSRAEAGQISLEIQPAAVSNLIHTAADRLQPQFDDKGVDLDVAVSQDLPLVRVDPGRLAQVLLNLLGNALQYTPSGGRVTIRAWHEGHAIAIAVQDTGIGIPAEALPHIFERFYRVDKSRARTGGGSGIGLTIARHLVEAQGGRIWAESPGPGQGSILTFTLPLAS
ncbi:MAG: HAMP domain-containing protein [Chloroflexi bacterium]|nr:HAMP domain-containing protein [Chloroflexota bacterium]